MRARVCAGKTKRVSVQHAAARRAAACDVPRLRTARYLGAPINHFAFVVTAAFDIVITEATGAHLFVSDARSADGPPKAWRGLIAVDSYTTSNMLFFFFLTRTSFLY